MDWAGGLRELLRPPPHRGPLIAAGAVPLAVGIALEELRLSRALPAGVHMVILLGAGALIYWLGVQAPNEDGRPPAYQSVLLVTGLLLLWAGLLRAAGVLGADPGGLPAGALAWTAALAAALALWPAFERNSALCLLLAAVLTGVSLTFAVRWVFAPDSPAPCRWLALAPAIALVLAALSLRGPAPRHAELLLDAAGLAVAAIGLSGVVDSSAVGLAGVWEVALLAAGFGLLAFGA